MSSIHSHTYTATATATATRSRPSIRFLAFAATLLAVSLSHFRTVESFSGSSIHSHPSRSISSIQQQQLQLQLRSKYSRSSLRSPFESKSATAARFFQPLLATPETKAGVDIDFANASSVAQVERAWTLDASSDSSDVLDPMDAVDGVIGNNNNDDDDSNNSGLLAQLTSVDVLGPLLTIGVVIVFLCSTLLNSGGISDTFLGMDLSHKLNVLSKISWFPGQYQEAQLVVGLVMAFSAFAQALTGFGFAVVAVGAMSSMPWLLHSELFSVITPVAATLGALVGFILLIPYAFSSAPKTEEEPGLEWDEILPLLIPCTILTPLGMQLNSMVDPLLATRILAALIMGFVGYKLVPIIGDALQGDDDDVDVDVEPDNTVVIDMATGDIDINNADADAEPSFLQSRTAAILMGSAAGIFGGAFDVQGPPLCVYGDAKGWSPARFRNNVLAVVCLNSALVVAIDYFRGDLGDFYYSYFCLTSLPGVLLGVVAGQFASERIDPVLFKNLVLVMCLGLGLQLLTVS